MNARHARKFQVARTASPDRGHCRRGDHRDGLRRRPPAAQRLEWDPLKSEAESIAENLRFARQRAIMTGVPHRLLIDLEEGGYQIEWFVSQGRALGGIRRRR